MSLQLAIDFNARARNSDPQTSHEAAAGVNTTELERQVLMELRLGGRGTSHDLAARLGISLVTVSPRMKPLEDKGKVRRAGRDGKRTIWEAIA